MVFPVGQPMKSDLEIARDVDLKPIAEVAKSIGLSPSDLRLHGRHVAKVTWGRVKSNAASKRGKLVLVTSVNPTPFGEGKTVTTIGLNPVSYTHLTLPTKA